MQFHWSKLALFLVAAVLVGCAHGDINEETEHMEQGQVSSRCPVTFPNADVTRHGAQFNYGNGDLWTSVWPDGNVVFRPGGPGIIHANGSLSMKWPWYLERGVRGELEVEGRRLDAPSERSLSADYSPVLGDPGFHAGGITFPSEGCWEVTGKAGDASLTFVTRVVKGRTLETETSEVP